MSTQVQNNLIEHAPQESISSQIVSYKNLAYAKVQTFTSEQQRKIQTFLNVLIVQKDYMIKLGKDSKFAQNIEVLAEEVITTLENQLSQLNYLYTKQKLNLKEVEQKKQILQRLQVLALSANALITLIGRDQFTKVKDSKMAQNAHKVYQNILANPRVRELIIFAQISREVVLEYYTLGQEKLRATVVVPSIEYTKSHYTKAREQITLTGQNLKAKVFEQYIPLVQERYTHLKNATISFYQNKVTVEFASEYYETNKQNITTELNEVYVNFMKYQTDVKQRYENIYKGALDSYKVKRVAKLEQFERL